jgi:hypothetical protein
MEFQMTQALHILERTPAVFRALLAGLPGDWTTPNEGPDTFSAFDNVAHMIELERTDWIPRARIILEQGENRTFQPVDRFAHYEKSRGRTMAELLDEFAQLRSENIDTLQGWSVTDAQLALKGEHPVLGSVSLRQLLATWVVHDLGHLAQTSRVIAKQYRDAAGPWRAFLPVLDR